MGWRRGNIAKCSLFSLYTFCLVPLIPRCGCAATPHAARGRAHGSFFAVARWRHGKRPRIALFLKTFHCRDVGEINL